MNSLPLPGFQGRSTRCLSFVNSGNQKGTVTKLHSPFYSPLECNVYGDFLLISKFGFPASKSIQHLLLQYHESLL